MDRAQFARLELLIRRIEKLIQIGHTSHPRQHAQEPDREQAQSNKAERAPDMSISAPVVETHVRVAEKNYAAERQENEAKERRIEFQQRERREWILLWVQVALFIAAMATVWVTAWQAKVMKDTLVEMAKQTPGIIQAGEASVTSANINRDTLHEQQIASDRDEIENDRTAKENQNSLERTLSQSKAALDASIANSRLDQRPWVTLEGFRLSKEPVTGEEISITWDFRNSGKTPALDLVTQNDVRIVTEAIASTSEKTGFDFITTFLNPGMPKSVTVIPPGDNTVYGVTNPMDFRKDNREWLISNYREKRARLYLFVLVRYKDIAKIPHWTSVCAYHNFGDTLTTFMYCPQGNTMDQNQKENDPIGPPRCDPFEGCVQ